MLTKRQREILTLIGEGLTSKQIAKKILIAPTTVNKTIYALCDKYGCTNRTNLLNYAYKNNLLTNETA